VGIKGLATAALAILVTILKLADPLDGALVAISVSFVALWLVAVATNVEVDYVDETKDGRRHRRLLVRRRKWSE
jgi:Co/Zn/Cd efflux system component